MAGPLAGYRVLDLSRILAGPWLAQLLSDLGAEVWKIERPGTGDDTRQWGPPFLRKDGGIDTTESAYFLSANRGKHSICVDISTDEGSAIVRALAQQADLVIENYKVGDMVEFGLSRHLSDIVTVTDARMERILRRAGWPLRRIGAPSKIGNTLAVAGYLDISSAALAKLRGAGGLSGPVLWAPVLRVA